MITLIGTPPNIVIATFREDALGTAYGMFDFAPVGIVVAVVGVVFVAVAGWRLIPVERSKHNSAEELGDLSGYVSELRVQENSKAVGNPLKELEPLAEENDVACSVWSVAASDCRAPPAHNSYARVICWWWKAHPRPSISSLVPPVWHWEARIGTADSPPALWIWSKSWCRWARASSTTRRWTCACCTARA
jgi:hypothetical protein